MVMPVDMQLSGRPFTSYHGLMQLFNSELSSMQMTALINVDYSVTVMYTVFRKKTPTHIFFYISVNYLWI